MTSFLEQILARKRVEVAERRTALPDRELAARAPPTRRRRARSTPPSRPRAGPVRIVAEVKRASPSAGRHRRRPRRARPGRAATPRRGAAAISVLTDGPGFGGSLDDLPGGPGGGRACPLLRKDFVLDRYQLLEARAAGADAALLIVAALARRPLRRLLDDCAELGLAALVEVHDLGRGRARRSGPGPGSWA